MSTVPVGQYLKDVSFDQARQGSMSLVEFITRPDHQGRQSDLEARLEEAHIRGVLEGRAEAQAEFDQRLEHKIAELGAAFARERAEWVEDQAGALHTAITTELARSTDNIADQVARILQPFVEERTRTKALSDLKGLLDQMMFKGDYRKITVEGPEDLVTSLKERMGDDVQGITFAAGGKTDLVVSADETILEARISSWVDAIRGEAE